MCYSGETECANCASVWRRFKVRRACSLEERRREAPKAATGHTCFEELDAPYTSWSAGGCGSRGLTMHQWMVQACSAEWFSRR